MTRGAALATIARMTATRVSLREITPDNLRDVLRLQVAEDQKGFVAPNAVSLSQALFAPEAWYRAIYDGDTPVGFVMLEDESLGRPPPAQPSIGVWRLMIDHQHQKRGFGRAALQLVIAHAEAKGLFDRLELSFVPGPGCPEPFYLSLGFRHTGSMDGAEVVLERPLERRGPAPTTPPAPALDPQQAWHRKMAAQCNNRAWELSTRQRTPEEGREMLDAAHASAFHWAQVGTELQRMRATMLLAEVHAASGHGATALALAETVRRYFLAKDDTPDWERAFVHAVDAHAAHAAGDAARHRAAHAEALSATAAIADPEDRAVVEQTLAVVPAP